ncbi:type II toxin-antitoxin system RelE/ParE family toxin [Sulfitobacter pacificus]|uniref:Plasmid maintenance system killer protein n=1 Tax=Sulfitobacter pacificus TaxID=1499314 RepID=A0ABQ5VJE6_9RHOB|nr:type II toxin-antitoxin system RelE/ParE family toxin [Sulfitobacter pacificus]GLQ27217.1 plasmid maintenance system killer protein [Sulfitobacter pacificus]
MIKTFACKHTCALHIDGQAARQFRPFARQAKRKLLMLHAASEYRDLTNPPGNRLEKLQGNRAGQSSIRINDQWRICFRWDQGDAYDVEICDYH